MEPARSPQEPPVYVSPQSREERQLVKELQTITGLEAHVAQRRSHRRPAPRSDRVGGVLLIFSVSLCGKTVIRVFLDAVRE